MTGAELWAEALQLPTKDDALRANILRHIRDAVREAGYVSRGRITSGIKEAFQPLGVAESKIRVAIDEALSLLMRTGDIDELSTGAGRGYAPTPPRRLIWDGADDVVLGGIAVSSDQTVRRLASDATNRDLISVPLLRELGRPAWRDALVGLGGSDAPNSDATALAAFAQALTSSGERFSLDQSNAIALLSGTGDYFGSPADLDGRWARPQVAGFYPAVVQSGYTKRRVLLAIEAGAATLWEPPNRDVWDWIVVGFTLAAGHAVWRYDRATQIFVFLTPPPRQVERAAMLTGEQIKSWSWRVDPAAQAIIGGLLGPLRS